MGFVIVSENSLLTIQHVDTAFKVNGQFYNAITDVSLDLYPDEILAIVGESGCGKSTLATSVIGLHNMSSTEISGSIVYHQRVVKEDGSVSIKDHELVGMSADEMNALRGNDMGMIFQDPLAALNPLMRIGDQIKENLDFHTTMSEEEKQARVIELLDQVGIPKPERIARMYPHELSGGMRQRVIIAIAVACKPDVIIADEPTTALDVTIQAQILDLLRDIQEEKHAGVILITHDLGVVAETADRVAVMYAGQIVEVGSTKQIFENPKHPISTSFAVVASRCFGITFLTITSPFVAAAANINVPASIWSGMMEYSVLCNFSTPRIRITSVPAPLMLAPILFKKFAASTTCGSRAAFSIIVYPFAIEAAIIILIVAPTDTVSKKI